MSLLIQNADCVTVERRWRTDLRCRDGRIVEMGESLEPASDENSIDASGLLVLPGGVDPHVHLQLPVSGTVSADDFASGTAAALAGGTTTIIDFVHPERGQDYLEALRDRRAEARQAVVDYGLHMGITWWSDASTEWIERCVRDEGIPSFKIYMAYLETVGLSDHEIIRALAATAEVDGMVLVHAEHGEAIEYLRDRLFERGITGPIAHPRSRPPQTEGEACQRIAMLASVTGACIYVVHVTCQEAVAAIAAARSTGQQIHGETCPQYLVLDDSVYQKPDFEAAAYVIAPPIRAAVHQEALWRGIVEGVLEVVATDHCPFNLEGQKELGRDDFRKIPGGAAGVQDRLSLLFTHGVTGGRFDMHRFVDLVSTRPAKLFGLFPRKGTIAVGTDADLVLWDPAATGTISAATHRHRCDRSIYEGFSTYGRPVTVIAAGEIRYHDGELRVEHGAGRFLHRQPGGGA